MFFKKKNIFDEKAKNLSQTAVDYAQDFQKDFDYSPGSVSGLESILDYYQKDIEVSRPTENQIWSMAMIFGSYLGEVMLKNGLNKKGYEWGMDEESGYPFLITEDKSFVTPIHKVYKRLANGPEDSVVSFFDVIMGL